MLDLESAIKSSSKLRQLRLLAEIYRESQDWDRRQVPTAGLYNEGHLWGIDVSALKSDFNALMAAGWIYFEASAGGVDEVLITQEGIDAAQEFQERRGNPRQRASALRVSLLNWLYDQHLSGEEPKDFTPFQASPEGKYLGLGYRDEEIVRAAKSLRDKGYIQVWAPVSGNLLKPTITTSGIDIIELSESAAEARGHEGMTVNNFNIRDSHSMNIALNSPGAVQTNTLTAEQVDQVRKVGTFLREVKPVLGLPDDRREEADQLVAELEEETTAAEPKPSRIKALLFKVIEVAATGTAQSAVDVVTSMAQSAIEGMG
ncbi:hypothetical protein PV768_18525 [Pseudarthrobacter sp. CC4]|uniref:hypothetical protein n=1 Tax=Pseudarthrobacter sp. CC4 TaxID=3029190 RepID=UPI003B8AAD8C